MAGQANRTMIFAFYTVSPPSGGASAVTDLLTRNWPGERVLVQIGRQRGEHQPAPGLKIITLQYERKGERWQKLASVRLWIREMAEIAVREQPDTIVLEGASWSAYHWVLVRALRRCVSGTKLIYHAHNVEYDLRRQKHSWLVAAVTRWCERRLVVGVDVSTSVSDADAERFRSLYNRDTVLLPNYVDIAWLRNASSASIETMRTRFGLTRETVLFMGSYSYKPNKQAIDFLVNDIFPAIIANCPQAKLLILGGPVPFERAWLIAPGLVPRQELPAFLRTAALSVAPIFSGSGTRLKIIESLAAGIPVITTAKGAEGLGLRDGKHLLYAETAKDLQQAILNLLKNRDSAECMAAEAFSFVASKYDCKSSLQKFMFQMQKA